MNASRHYVQQSEYTVCVKKDGGRIVFTSHEDAFAKTEQGENLLWKFTLPIAERVEVLKMLDHMNINSLSLFGTEDSLLETIAWIASINSSDPLPQFAPSNWIF